MSIKYLYTLTYQVSVQAYCLLLLGFPILVTGFQFTYLGYKHFVRQMFSCWCDLYIHFVSSIFDGQKSLTLAQFSLANLKKKFLWLVFSTCCLRNFCPARGQDSIPMCFPLVLRSVIHLKLTFLQSRDSHSVFPRPAASVSLENLLKMQILSCPPKTY